MPPADCQAPECEQPSSAGTAFCAGHHAGFRWHRGTYVIHCTEPGAYVAVSKWTGQRRAFTSYEDAEAYALRPRRSRVSADESGAAAS